jgi:hypothetical protein
MDSNIIYDYKKSSCNCYNCDSGKFKFEKGYSTNLAVDDCQIPKYLDCFNEYPFKNDIEPSYENSFTTLNPNAMKNKYDPTFQSVDCSSGNSPNVCYISNDPRLISAYHNGQRLTLDRPPIDSSMKLDTINTNKKLTRYGQDYKNYEDIDAGQITYYVDNSIKNPFNLPVFATSANVLRTVYKDPMDSIKPHYYRTPMTNRDALNTNNSNYQGCLSFIQDSNEFREDIISKQMSRNNQQRWEPRWG